MTSPKTPWVPILVAAFLAGGVGAWIGRTFAPAPRSPIASPAPPAAERDPDPELARRVDRLERRVASLGVERAAAPGDSAPKSPQADDGAAHRTVDDPVFQAAVRDVVEQRDEERRASRQKRAVVRLTDKLELDERQQEAVAALLQEMSAGLRELREGDQDPSGDKSRELRSRTEARFSQVVKPDQLERYKKLDDSDRIFSGDGRRGPFGF